MKQAQQFNTASTFHIRLDGDVSQSSGPQRRGHRSVVIVADRCKSQRDVVRGRPSLQAENTSAKACWLGSQIELEPDRIGLEWPTALFSQSGRESTRTNTDLCCQLDLGVRPLSVGSGPSARIRICACGTLDTLVSQCSSKRSLI